MAKFIIHVGPHKTGSTYIQFGLLLNRQALLEHGISYPDAFCTEAVRWCHFGLFQMLRESRHTEIATRFDTLAQDGAKSIVLSSEDLSTLDEKELDALRALTGEDVEVVYYLRRWSELLPSNAQEDIRHGGTRTLPEVCVDHLAAPYRSSILNFIIKLERLARVFGIGSLRIISFNNVLENRLDLFSHFVDHLLRVDSTPLSSPTQKHPSQSIQKIEILRALNGIRKQQTNAPTSWNAGIVIAKFAKYDMSNIFHAMELHRSSFTVDEFVRPFSNIFKEVVDRFGAFVLPPYANGIIFERQKTKIPYIKPDYLLMPGVVDRLAEIYKLISNQAER